MRRHQDLHRRQPAHEQGRPRAQARLWPRQAPPHDPRPEIRRNADPFKMGELMRMNRIGRRTLICMAILAALIALWHALPSASNMARPPAKIFGGGAA